MKPYLVQTDLLGVEGLVFELVIPLEEALAALRERGCRDTQPVSPVRARIKLSREGDEIRLAGDIEAGIETSCVRCLEPVRNTIKTSLALVVKRGGARRGSDLPEEVELDASDLDVELAEGSGLDLNETVMEEITASLPEYPLCREDCKGLCPDCGAELNRAGCDCATRRSGDPRLAVLARLKGPKP